MSEQGDKKVCRTCAMEISAAAKKCPYCHYWQNRWLGMVYHPAFVFVALVPLLAAYGLMMERMFSRGKDFQPYRDQVKVVSSEIKFSDDPNMERVVVVGRLKNESDYDWKDLILSFEFQNAEGKLVDGGQDSKYGYYISAHDEGTFRVSAYRAFPRESYAACRVRVVYAKDGKAWF